MLHNSYEMDAHDLRVAAVLNQLSDDLAPASLAALDQFHAGGAGAADRLLSAGRLGSGQTVADLGCCLGGPARRAARRSAKVIGIDQTAAFVALPRELTRRCGPADLASFHVGDMTAPALPGASADH